MANNKQTVIVRKALSSEYVITLNHRKKTTRYYGQRH